MRYLFFGVLVVTGLTGCQEKEEQQAVAAAQAQIQAQAQASGLTPYFLDSETKRGTRWGPTGKTYQGLIIRQTFVVPYKGRPDTLKSAFIVDSVSAAVVPVEWDYTP